MLAGELDHDNSDSGRIEIAPGMPLTDEEIARELSVSLDMWIMARQYFERVGMLAWDGQTLVLCNYQKRQQADDPTGAKRQKQWRQRQKAQREYIEDILSDVRDNLQRNDERYVTRDVTHNVTGVTSRDFTIKGTRTTIGANGNGAHPEPPAPKAFDLFIKARAGAVNSIDMENLGDLVDLYGDENVSEAIRVCNTTKKQGFLSFSHLIKTLQGWQRDGKRYDPNAPTEEKKPYAAEVVQ